MATQITFTWEETDEMSFDQMMDQLMFLGAEDIETKEFERPAPEPEPKKRKKPPVGHSY